MTPVVPRRRHKSDFFSLLLCESGVGPDSAVRVTGRDSLAPLIWLCRHGFDDVAYVRAGAGGPHEPGDVLIAIHTASLDELQRLLDDHTLLREGGVLIVQTPDLRGADGIDPVHAVLEANGYQLQRCIAHHASEVHIARRRLQPALARAA